ncbi:Shiga toxin A subunit [Candidatus Pantoea deserta]|uniref:Shiga toxin A subunit n=1 Tax=Candidatus Pantoea deserta TaxID=1869313 RepID=A0A3N4PJ96_9GAMM|nr:Shiga toxin A subunit [Pantoea deserta]
MKRFFALYLFALPALSSSDIDAGCAKAGTLMYIDLTDAIARDLHIDRAMLVEKNTTVEVIDISPVSKLFAEQMANADYNEQAEHWLSKEEYFDIYYNHRVKNITAKYTFKDIKGNRDVFIASSLLNDDECSVRFNGYMTLSREF